MMKLFKTTRAQAAMEFLSTYGWAFMILLLMVGAMSYLGLTDVDMFIPERCQFESEALCQDFQIITTGSQSVVMIQLDQTTGRSMYLQDFTCEDLGQGVGSNGYYMTGVSYPDERVAGGLPLLSSPTNDAYTEWQTSETILIACEFSANIFSGREGDKVRVPVEVTVQKRDGGFNHIIEGDVIAVVQGE